MSNRVEPQISSIKLDQDQVKQQQPAPQHSKRPTAKDNSPQATKVKTRGTDSSVILAILPYIALIGASGYFYQQQTIQNQLVAQSEQRIQQLENQLSATGEEMGESTIALKVKLEAISEKTELLLTEMDKLWGSAWRRNQKEIKEIRSQQIKFKQSSTTNHETQKSRLQELTDKLTATEFSIDAISEQIVAANTVKDTITQLNGKLTALDNQVKTRDEQQMITATSINELDTSVQLLIERIAQIEQKIKPTNKPVKSTPL